MLSVHSPPRAVKPRCPHCAGVLEHFQGDAYCPSCTSYRPAPPPCPVCGRPCEGPFSAEGACRHCGDACPGVTLCPPCDAAGVCAHCGGLPDNAE
jgi:hypothetical protein